jgi:hypothetical protein
VRFDMRARSHQTLQFRLPPAVLRRASHGRLRLRESVVPTVAGTFVPVRRVIVVVVPAHVAIRR